MVNVLSPIPALIGLTGQVVIIGVGLGVLSEIDKTSKRIKKTNRGFPNLTEL